METEIIFFTENISDNSLLESGLSDFDLQAVSSPEPDDEDEEDTEEEAEDKTEDSPGGDPPLDKGVVHSPVTTLPGGKPK